MIQLNLTPENQAALEESAAAAGIDLSTFVWEAVKDRIQESARSTLVGVPHEVWKKHFDAFIASQRSWNPNFDDRRESIYD